MNIVWIEDFGGLSAGKNILNQMFSGLVDFDAWDNKKYSLISRPTDLENFCKDQKSLHTIYLCLNYFDYVTFKNNHSILNEIDLIITDVRLDNDVDFSLAIPNGYDVTKFHEEAGFFIFNDLIHLGFPESSMCFMTGEKNSFKGFAEKCREIYMPEVKAFEKIDADYQELRNWIKEKETDYSKLRRGIIEGCHYLKKLKDKVRFNNYAVEKKTPFLDIDDYLATLKDFLPLREPTDKKTLFKLFIRTLSHEWEESVEPKTLDDKCSYAFSWIMKMTRNWIAHNSTAIFTDLTEQDVAYLFICNMRAMFDLGDAVQPYEELLFSLFNINDNTEEKVRNKTIPLIDTYVSYFNESTNRTDVHNILHDLQNNKIKLQNKGDKFFITGLYHCFWFLTSTHNNQKDKAKPNQNNLNQVFISRYYTFDFFNYEKTDFLFELASRIYNRSFPN